MRSQGRSSAQKCFKNSCPVLWECATSGIRGGMGEKVYREFSERQQRKSGKRLQGLKSQHDARTPTQSLLIWSLCGRQNYTWHCISLSWQVAVLLWSCSWELKQESRRIKKQRILLVSRTEMLWRHWTKVRVSSLEYAVHETDLICFPCSAQTVITV